MKVKHIIEYFQKEYDPEDNIMLAGRLYYTFELEPDKVCGTTMYRWHFENCKFNI